MSKVRLPASAGWSKLLFSSGSSCIALQLQLCLVSSSLSKVEQFSFECCTLSQRSAMGSTTCPALGGWPVTLPPLLAFVDWPLFIMVHWEFSTESSDPCPTPILWSRFRVPPPPPLLVSDYSLLFMFFSFAGGRVQCAQGLHWIIFPRGWVGESCMVLTCFAVHTSIFGASW
jgi:hypothetical protein